MRTTADNERWVGEFGCTNAENAVWGRSEPHRDQQPHPDEKQRYVVQPGYVADVDYAVTWGRNGTWLHDANADLWLPLTMEDGTSLLSHITCFSNVEFVE